MCAGGGADAGVSVQTHARGGRAFRMGTKCACRHLIGVTRAEASTARDPRYASRVRLEAEARVCACIFTRLDG